MTWQRKPILVGVGLILAAFGLGVMVGARFMGRPAVYREGAILQSSSNPPPTPIPSANPNASRACVDIQTAASMVGKDGCISGLIRRVYTAASGNTFLDFCPDYRTCPFTSVIFAADKTRFGDVGSLEGTHVELRGRIVSYEGRAEIVVHEPRQIRSTP